jgi:transcriptional regulator with XRE-family HTH domain
MPATRRRKIAAPVAPQPGETERVRLPIDDLIPNPRNDNIHPQSQIDLLVQGIRRFGQPRAVLARKSNHMLIAGRLSREMSQRQLAEAIGMTKASVSRVESGQQPYTQTFLEQTAKALGCAPRDLLARPPDEMRAAWLILDQLEPRKARRFLNMLQALDDGGE